MQGRRKGAGDMKKAQDYNEAEFIPEKQVAKKRSSHRRSMIYAGIAAFIVVLNLLAWNSTAFCDRYIAYVFPIWVNTYGRVTGIFPFSVGEWMIVAGVVLVCLMVLCLPMLLLSLWWKWKKVLGFCRGYYRFFAWTLLIVALVMTLNCFILYHGSTFDQMYMAQEEASGDQMSTTGYLSNTVDQQVNMMDDQVETLEELLTVRNLVVEQCNRLSKEVARDDDGNVIYRFDHLSASHSDSGAQADDAKAVSLAMQDEARRTMQKLGETYPQLSGWYPRPKALLSSDFMCQQSMQGYYFPFSMEANYNDVMGMMRKPATMCHELTHLRGYIYEDEANFISFLACIHSDDVTFQYSGYLSVINYLDNDLYKAYKQNKDAYKKAVSKVRPLQTYNRVSTDNIFVTEEEWERINGKALISTETVDAAADTFIDTSLKVNGVSDGMISYSRVVKLLLQYYRQNS